jgi:leucyl aminopeptidase (aminopeptidase T)
MSWTPKEYLDSLPKELVTASRLDQQATMLDNLGDVRVAQLLLMELEKLPIGVAADNVIENCLAVKEREVVTVLTDNASEERVKIARALWEAAQKRGAEAIFVEMLPRKNSGEEPPYSIAALMAESDVVLCPTTKSLTHTKARQDACKRRARIATLPGITESIAIRCLSANYIEIAQRTEAVANALREGSGFRLRSANGTDIRLERAERSVFADTGLIQMRGACGNLPAGEAFFAPIEGTAEGEVVFDGSIGDIGKLDTPVRLVVQRGIAQVITDSEAARKLDIQLSKMGPEAYKIAELGVGTNDRAEIRGNILEDEKVLGTVHLAMGNNVGMGGTISVAIHLDGLVQSASLYVDDVLILENGSLRI